MDLYSILDIEEVHSLISMKFKVSLSWQESRLKFSNVQKNSILTYDQKNLLWLPRLEFVNTKYPLMAEFNTNSSIGSIELLQEAKGKLASMDELRNSYLHEGSQW